jgi:uncharacterized membrane protein YdbT with pleckstrin-like domain
MTIESFDGQRESEEIAGVWRQHPLVLFKPLFWCVLIFFVGSIPQLTWSPSWGYLFWLFFAAISGLYGILSYFLWLNTIYILTNERIFAIAHRALFFRSNNEVPLKNLQNVAHVKRGIFQMLFDFGSVEIETSGTKTAMTIKNVEHPYLVQQKILSTENLLK